MNADKSVVYLGGVSDTVQQSLLQVSGMTESSFPVHYLAVPMHQ